MIIVLAYYLYIERAEFSILSRINPFIFLLITVLNVLYLFINAIFLKVLLTKYKINIEIPNVFGLAILTSAANYFSFLWGGMAVKAVYLKKEFKLSYSDFLNSTLGSYLIIFFTSSVVASFVIILLSLSSKKIFYIPLFVFIGLALFSAILMQAPLLFENFFLKKIAEMARKWEELRSDRKLLLKLAAISLLNLFVAALLTYLRFKVLGITLGVFESFYISVIVSLAVLINLTPASIGIIEVLTAFAAKTLNINPVHAVLASSIDRVSILILIFIFAPPFNYYLFVKNKLKEETIAT